MYYRVKRFIPGPSTMDIIDSDENLDELKSRHADINCTGLGPHFFQTPELIESQIVHCSSQNGNSLNTYIIEY
jgi:hypothetical protein